MQKNFWQNSSPIYNKHPQKTGIEGTYLNIIKAIYDKPTANIILSDEKLRMMLAVGLSYMAFIMLR